MISSLKTILATLLLSALFIIFFPEPGMTSDLLVKIHVSDIDGLRSLPEQSYSICYKGDTYCLVTFSENTLNELGRYDIDYEILDRNAWAKPYYIIYNTRIEADENIIFQTDDFLIIRASDDEAMQHINNGDDVVRLSQTSLPLTNNNYAEISPRSIRRSPNIKQYDMIPSVADSTFRAYVQRLQDFETRYCLSDSIDAARDWLYEQFSEFGYAEVYIDKFRGPYNTDQYNVFAIKPGTQGTDRVIVVGGHYDSIVSQESLRMTTAPGADDNATGTAGTLELARILADEDLETTVIFVAFSAEELGLWGSANFAYGARAADINIDLMLNMDMIGYTDDALPDVNVLTDARSMRYAELVADIFNAHTTLIPYIGDSRGNSDHFYFQQNGYPALFIQEGDFNTPHYHSPSDLIEYLDIPYAVQVLTAMTAAVIHVSETPAPPTGLLALEVGDGQSQVVLWDPNQEPDIAEYHLFWGPASGDYTQMRVIKSSVDTLKSLSENTNVYAAVSALDVDGNESLLSTELIFSPRNIPLTPTEFSSTSASEQIQLFWDANNAEFDFAGYVITRTDPLGENTIFKVNKGVTSFSDISASPHTLYSYRLQAEDEGGNVSGPSNEVYGRLATHDRGIILVDGTNAGAAQPFRPDDATVDLFYENLLHGFNANAEWDLQDSSKINRSLTDADLAIYSTVVWHSDVIFGPRNFTLDSLAMKKYIHNGGKLILSGWRVLSNFTTINGDITVFPEGSFVHEIFNIDTVAVAQVNIQDFSSAIPVNGSYPAIEVDALKAAMAGGNLMAMETIVSLVDDQACEIIYNYGSTSQPPSSFDGSPIAIKCVTDSISFFIFDFPLFFMNKDQSSQLLNLALAELGELPTQIKDSAQRTSLLPEQSRLFQNYPNPFNPQTSISYQLAENAEIRLAIYNVAGQHVRTLMSGQQTAGNHSVEWNGQDDAGQLMSSGIYLYRLKAGESVHTRKLMLMK